MILDRALHQPPPDMGYEMMWGGVVVCEILTYDRVVVCEILTYDTVVVCEILTYDSGVVCEILTYDGCVNRILMICI